MILNNAVLQSFGKTDKRWWMKVLNLSLVTQEYATKLPKSVKFPTFECHTICRAIAKHIHGLKVVDGYYVGVAQQHRNGKVVAQLQYCEHSWLVTPSGSIIDPYPVGCLATNPILVVNRGKYKNFGGDLYWPDRFITKKVCTQRLREKVKILSRIAKEAEKHARRSEHS
ncbi:MAG: hypothetical protein WC735_01335 [Candidatus Paceibacterota bacterium]